jgi:hypothetical protein
MKTRYENEWKNQRVLRGNRTKMVKDVRLFIKSNVGAHEGYTPFVELREVCEVLPRELGAPGGQMCS